MHFHIEAVRHFIVLKHKQHTLVESITIYECKCNERAVTRCAFGTD